MSGISLSSNNLILVYILWFILEACGEWVYKIFLFLTIWHIFIVYLWLHSVLNLSLLLLLFYLISLLTLLSRLYEFLSHILIIFLWQAEFNQGLPCVHIFETFHQNMMAMTYCSMQRTQLRNRCLASLKSQHFK